MAPEPTPIVAASPIISSIISISPIPHLKFLVVGTLKTNKKKTNKQKMNQLHDINALDASLELVAHTVHSI